MKAFLLRARLIGRLMELFFDEVSPHKEFFRSTTDLCVQEEHNPEIGFPTEYDQK